MAIGFTRQEQGVVLFLVLSLVAGLVVRGYQRYFLEPPDLGFDSRFYGDFNRKATEINDFPVDSLVSVDVKKKNNRKISFGRRQVPLKKVNLPTTVVNVNSASEKELESLPGIGPMLAKRIVAYRLTQGSFTSIDDLRKVKGVGRVKLDKMKPYIAITTKKEFQKE